MKLKITLYQKSDIRELTFTAEKKIETEKDILEGVKEVLKIPFSYRHEVIIKIKVQ